MDKEYKNDENKNINNQLENDYLNSIQNKLTNQNNEKNDNINNEIEKSNKNLDNVQAQQQNAFTFEITSKFQKYEKFSLITSLVHQYKVFSMACKEINDNVIIAAGCENGQIFIWDLNLNKIILTIDAYRDLFVECLDFLDIENKIKSNTVLVSTCIDYYIKLWNPKTGENIRSIFNESRPLCMTFVTSTKHSKTIIVVANKDKKINFWDLDDGTLFFQLQDFSYTITIMTNLKVNNLASERILVCGCDDNTIRLFNSAKGNIITNLFPEQEVRDGNAYSLTTMLLKYDQTVVSGHYEVIRIWDPQTGAVIRSWVAHNNFVTSLSAIQLLNKIPFLVSGSKDFTIKIWNPEKKQLIISLDNHWKKIVCLRSVNFKMQHLIISASSDASIKVFN